MIKKSFNSEPIIPQECTQPLARVVVIQSENFDQSWLQSQLESSICHFKFVSMDDFTKKSIDEGNFNIILMTHPDLTEQALRFIRDVRNGSFGERVRRIAVLQVVKIDANLAFEKFLLNGVDDFVTDPSEPAEFAKKLKLWADFSRDGLDIRAIKRLRDLPKGNDLVHDVAQMFFEDTPKVLTQLRILNCEEKGELKKFLMLAHNLKSNCAILGAFRMNSLAFALEKVKTFTVDERFQLISLLEKECAFFKEQFYIKKAS